MGKVKVGVGLTLVLLLALFVGACGGSTETTTTTAGATGATTGTTPAAPTTVKVGILPYSGMGPIWLGIEKGIFQKNGLNLDLVAAEAPAPILASVQSGQEQFGFATTIALINAISGGLKVAAVSPVDGTVDPNESSTAIIVGPNSTIKSPADLGGKKIAVPALGSEIDLLVHAAAERAGVDPKTVQTVQVPFPTMWSAVKAGRVDAAGTTEPFLSQAIAAGAKNINDAEKEILKGDNVTAFVTTSKYASENPQVVQAFRAAMAESIAYSKAHVDEVRTIIAKNTGLDPSAAQKMKLGIVFDPNFNMAGLTDIANLMVKYGFIKQAPTADQIVLPSN